MFLKVYNIIRRILGMQPLPAAPNLKAKMRKFKFVVINGGSDGGMSMYTQPQVAIAPSPQYLERLYLQSGDRIKILEELPDDDETRNYGKTDISRIVAETSSGNNWAAGGSLGTGKMMVGMESEEQIRALQAMHGNAVQQPQAQQPVQQQPQDAPQTQMQQPQQAVQQNSQPSYFKVNGMECKMENGKVYQRQWTRITEEEMANYRMVSDKTNRIMPFDGKHLETMKWVCAEG